MPMDLDVMIRPLQPHDQPYLRQMLYHAIYVHDGADPPPTEIIKQPELSRYIAGWGRPGDDGFIAFSQKDKRLLGAAWYRLFDPREPGYGVLDEITPELAIALFPGCRNRGIGAELMGSLLSRAACQFEAISLSVDARNWAASWYGRLGFEIVSTNGRSFIMRKQLS